MSEDMGINSSIDWWQYREDFSSFVDEDEIVGMEEDRTKLLEWLAEDNPRRTIISIVGMGGLGKTTLVTKVYNEQTIQQMFDCRAWISVSQTKGVEELLKYMIKELFIAKVPRNLGSMNYRELVETLILFLRNKRYIIILDDVWSIALWSRIRCAFPDNSLGSRVIFTTRNENVATSVGPGSRAHRLEPLQETDSWALFCKKAFWSSPNRTCPVELEALARDIMRKCEGLPLALVAIGGLMCSRTNTAAEWQKVYNSLNWQLSNNPVLERVKGILLLSFNDLPFYLKHCFMYCCVFRYSYPIKRKKLIRLWVAEGFVLERKGVTMEEIAEDYLTELIFRSMIQVTGTNEAGRVKTVRVHDVMRELAVMTSEKENFCAVYDGREARLEGKTQRVSVYYRGENIRLSKSLLRHLRSFFVFRTEICPSFSLNSVSSNFKFLRVLDLQGVHIETIPDALVELFNLRYLNLRETEIRKLPKSIEKLQNLQTVDVRNTKLEKLPKGISEIPNLRHLFLSGNINRKSETLSLSRGLMVPAGIGKVRSLQTLTCLEAEEELIRQIGNLDELRRLDIIVLRASDGRELCNSIGNMASLRHLSIMSGDEQEELQLETLALYPLFLQKLKLVGQLKWLPRWLASLVNLTHLYLWSSQLEGDDAVVSISTLPNLSFLELKNGYNGRLLHFKEQEFPKLNKLSLRELANLDSIRIEAGGLPSLRDLYITRCQGLKSPPQGIEHLTSLQRIHLEEMPDDLRTLLSERSNDDDSNVHVNIICSS